MLSCYRWLLPAVTGGATRFQRGLCVLFLLGVGSLFLVDNRSLRIANSPQIAYKTKNVGNHSGGVERKPSPLATKSKRSRTHGVVTSSRRRSLYKEPLAVFARKQSSDNTTSSLLPVPAQIMEQYKQWHSVEALRRDHSAAKKNRRFALGVYSCPYQGGNRMHHFTNALLWAILTNRTFLWKYSDAKTCKGFDHYHADDPEICINTTEADCHDHVLVRAPWIPSYDEWSIKLQLAPPTKFPFQASTPNATADTEFEEWYHNASIDIESAPRIFGWDDTSQFQQHQVALFAMQRLALPFMAESWVRRQTLSTEWARRTARRLYCYGTYFLYGMLWRYSFDFGTKLVSPSPPPNAQAVFSIGVHSRHRLFFLDGCDISQEVRCLTKILEGPELSRLKRRVRVPVTITANIMSDRDCTIRKLTNWLKKQQHNVTVKLAEKKDKDPSWLIQHGEFAGIGYYQDWATVCRESHSAFVGARRSSSDLVLEVMQFNRLMMAWKNGEKMAQGCSDSNSRHIEQRDEILGPHLVKVCRLRGLAPEKIKIYKRDYYKDANNRHGAVS